MVEKGESKSAHFVSAYNVLVNHFFFHLMLNNPVPEQRSYDVSGNSWYGFVFQRLCHLCVADLTTLRWRSDICGCTYDRYNSNRSHAIHIGGWNCLVILSPRLCCVLSLLTNLMSKNRFVSFRKKSSYTQHGA